MQLAPAPAPTEQFENYDDFPVLTRELELDWSRRRAHDAVRASRSFRDGVVPTQRPTPEN